jgi:hypothetical protein
MGLLYQNVSFGQWLWCVERIQVVKDRDRWLPLVNTVMNIRVVAPVS